MINSKEAITHYERLESLAAHLGISADDLVEHLEDGCLRLHYGLQGNDAWWCFSRDENRAAINVRTGAIIEGDEIDDIVQ